MIPRRNFLAMIASLPVVGRMVPSTMVHVKRLTDIDRDRNAIAVTAASEMTVDNEGHRTYRRTFQASSEHPIGIPEHGSMYCYGNDIDYYAFAVRTVRNRRHVFHERRQWLIEAS